LIQIADKKIPNPFDKDDKQKYGKWDPRGWAIWGEN
jgi:hypothetical protein